MLLFPLILLTQFSSTPMSEDLRTLLKEASDSIAALERKNEELIRENEVLKAATEQNKVTLEKIASCKKEAAVEFVDTLINYAMLDETQRNEYVGACADNPAIALRIASGAIKKASAAVESGQGVQKTIFESQEDLSNMDPDLRSLQNISKKYSLN